VCTGRKAADRVGQVTFAALEEVTCECGELEGSLTILSTQVRLLRMGQRVVGRESHEAIELATAETPKLTW
jgi:hypothetical protein